ncbi:MAG: Omp28-related outer membrane protein [Bacteroidetes bacterium]|nr:Omp28-related outer membrane protein [Bacteroidota bacterium]
MKNLLSLSLMVALAIGFASCKKNSTTADGKNHLGYISTTTTTTPVIIPLPVGDVPATFTKKAVIEEFTGEWCQYCPDGGLIMDALCAGNNKIYGAAIHDGDFLTIEPFYTQITGLLPNTYGFPGATVDREPYGGENIFSRSSWGAAANICLGKVADCGLAMKNTEKNNTLDISVYCGYNKKISSDTKVTIYLLEDKVDMISQVNAPVGYMHNHVVRKVITATVGDAVSLTDMNKKYALLEFKGIDLVAAKIGNKANAKVLAFINVNGADKMSHHILNAQEAGLNETKKWD